MRWIIGTSALFRKSTIVPFAATMNSSIRWWAAVCSCTSRSRMTPASTTGRASSVWRARAPCSARKRLSRSVASYERRSCSSSPATADTESGTPVSPSNQAPINARAEAASVRDVTWT